jgi:DNA-binding response OmpR family regulator
MTGQNTCLILLVDDDKSWQNINRIVLKKHGYQIDSASTKAEAMDKIAKNNYEIAVVDLRLIDDDQSNFEGIEIIKELRNKDSQTSILVKSGYLSAQVENELKALGINKSDIFDKSTTNKELAERIAKLHGKSKHERKGRGKPS